MNFGSLDWRWGRASKESLDTNSLDPNALDEILYCTCKRKKYSFPYRSIEAWIKLDAEMIKARNISPTIKGEDITGNKESCNLFPACCEQGDGKNECFNYLFAFRLFI